jgi:hypothetical protein
MGFLPEGAGIVVRKQAEVKGSGAFSSIIKMLA